RPRARGWKLRTFPTYSCFAAPAPPDASSFIAAIPSSEFPDENEFIRPGAGVLGPGDLWIMRPFHHPDG
ncbi:MAG TPA: hypothetical protein VFJ82_23645, partial [Longimicrobium sp.]|nr:hypothetical protein [Longimicrobium sp.]